MVFLMVGTLNLILFTEIFLIFILLWVALAVEV